MRIREILESASVGATASGAVATVAQPLGAQTRNGGSFFSGKYVNGFFPRVQKTMKQNKGKNK